MNLVLHIKIENMYRILFGFVFFLPNFLAQLYTFPPEQLTFPNILTPQQNYMYMLILQLIPTPNAIKIAY